MPDPLTTMAAAIVTRDLDSPEERLALVAAASVIEGPLALAPALLALQRERAEDSDEAVAGKDKVGPLTVEVPSVKGMEESEALNALDDVHLKGIPEPHQSDQKEKGFVLDQDVDAGKRVPINSGITLTVGAGMVETKEAEAAASSTERTNQLLESMDEKLTALRADVGKIAAAPAPTPPAEQVKT